MCPLRLIGSLTIDTIGYIYHFLVYITGAVIYTKGYSGTDGDHTGTLLGAKIFNVWLFFLCTVPSHGKMKCKLLSKIGKSNL